MNTVKVRRDTRQLINQAWTRNGETILTGESLILVMLLHTTANNRDSDEFKVVQALMNDVNLDDKE